MRVGERILDNNKNRNMKVELKELRVGEKMPKDFWNYKVNPIVGYNDRELVNERYKVIEYEKKYELRVQNLGI